MFFQSGRETQKSKFNLKKSPQNRSIILILYLAQDSYHKNLKY
jgi:hypothetical protein